MAINAYVGRMGSGKSYEVVSHVILGALRRGRRVVSNIAGLNYEAMRELLEKEGTAPADIGDLVVVTNEQVASDDFWLNDDDAAKGIEAFIRPGDLVALDEIWRFWKVREQFERNHPRAQNFFRMHRHFVDPMTKRTCDVALISQRINDINVSIRGVIEETYRMDKATALGSQKRYRVDIYQGAELRGDPPRQMFKQYDPKYFALYSSYSQAEDGGAGKEEAMDGRGNVLKGALFKVGLPLAVVAIVGGLFFAYRAWHNIGAKGAEQSKAAEPSAADKAAKPQPASVDKSDAKAKPPEVVEALRVVGYFARGPDLVVAVGGEGGRLRYLVNAPVKMSAMSAEVQLPTGEFVGSWSGGEGQRGMVPNLAKGLAR